MKPQPAWTDDQKRRAKPWLALFILGVCLSTLAAIVSLVYIGTTNRPDLIIAFGIIIGGIVLSRLVTECAKRKLDRIENT